MSSETAQVALWYVRYGHFDYDLHDSEDEAAGAAVAMIEANTAAPCGVQFPDGRLIVREEWPAFAAAERQQQAWYAQAARRRREYKSPPQRKVTAPFGGGEIEIDADEPSWLGVTDA